MKKIIYILIGLFILCASNESYGQFWKKKQKGAVTSSKSSGGGGGSKKDSFKGKSKKGANVYSEGSKSKSKGQAYSDFSSKKKRKTKGGSSFSSTKKRYGFVNTKKPKGDQGSPRSNGGRKSGKGRKK